MVHRPREQSVRLQQRRLRHPAGLRPGRGLPDARDAYLHDGEAILLNDAPVIPLYYLGGSYQLRDGLTGLYRAPDGVYFLSAVTEGGLISKRAQAAAALPSPLPPDFIRRRARAVASAIARGAAFCYTDIVDILTLMVLGTIQQSGNKKHSVKHRQKEEQCL